MSFLQILQRKDGKKNMLRLEAKLLQSALISLYQKLISVVRSVFILNG